jgi:aerobic-type carbon monoxide dehydrogenase small subunit (CoxS/CutS family)
MSKLHVCIKINGEDREFQVAPDDKLLEVIRREGYSGTKRGCNAGACGSCTVLLDGKIVYACLLFAFQAHGRRVDTIESVGDFDNPHPIQKALVEEGAVQCGFCIPGIILAAKSLMDVNPTPTDDELKIHMDGNLCRCTGYEKIESALRKVIAAGGAK